MFLPPLVTKVSIGTALYIIGYCFAQFFLPFALVLLPLDFANSTLKSLPWFVLGLVGLAVVYRRAGLGRIIALVFCLAATFGCLIILRFFVDCVWLQKNICLASALMAKRNVLLGGFSLIYLVIGLLFVMKTRPSNASKNSH